MFTIFLMILLAGVIVYYKMTQRYCKKCGDLLEWHEKDLCLLCRLEEDEEDD